MVIIAHSLYKNNKKYDEEVYKKAVGISEWLLFYRRYLK
jgi:hypothetical protein